MHATWNWPRDWPREQVRAWYVQFAYADCSTTPRAADWRGPIIVGADPTQSEHTAWVQWLGPDTSVHMRVAALRQGDANLGPYTQTACATTPPT